MLGVSPLDDPLAFRGTTVPAELYDATLAEAFGDSSD
jgi:hypothetical protein